MKPYLIYYIIFLLNIKITENTKAILIFNKKMFTNYSLQSQFNYGII